MKRRHRKIRSVCKWSGAVLTVLLVVVWVGSGWWTWGFGTSIVTAGVWDGQLVIGWTQSPGTFTQGLRFDAADHFEMRWWFRREVFSGSTTMVGIPIWALVLFASIPTGWLWWRDRRYRAPGLCIKCGYDLRGAEHGVCPECGSVMSA